jgi:hypothetical protein
MTLVALCSFKGSPGVTTTALGLAASWPSADQPVVVECDPAGGDLLARFRLETAPGLVSLAAAARRGGEPGVVWQHTQRLPGGLPVVAGPAGADQARASLAQLTRSGTGLLRRAADRSGTVVIADCGRLDGQSPVLEVVREADITLVLARARDEALSHAATQFAAAGRWSRRVCFVLVGDGYPTGEVERVLEVKVTGRVPEDPKGAAALGGRPGWRSAQERSPLGRALAQLASAVVVRAYAPGGWIQAPDPGPPPPRASAAPAADGRESDPRQVWSGAGR